MFGKIFGQMGWTKDDIYYHIVDPLIWTSLFMTCFTFYLV